MGNSVNVFAAARGGDVEALAPFVHQTHPDLFKDENSWTILMVAAYEGRAPIVDFLLKQEADPNISDHKTGATALHLAVEHFHPGVIKALLNSGATFVDQSNNKQQTPLHFAASHSHPTVVKWLLEAGANTNRVDENGFTALMHACLVGSIGCVELLLAAGSDVATKNKQEDSSLLLAVEHGYVDIVRMLLASGADVHIGNARGWTSVMIAAHAGYPETISALIENGGSTNDANREGRTPLMMACNKAKPAAVEFLIKAKASLNATDVHGCTALMLAARTGRFKSVAHLLAGGADAKLKNEDGRNALDHAPHNSRAAVFLTKHGLKRSAVDASPGKGMMVTPVAVSGWNKKAKAVLYDGSRRLFATDRKKVVVWEADIESGRLEAKTILADHTGDVRCVAWDKTLLFTGAEDNDIKVWEEREKNWFVLTETLSGHTFWVFDLIYDGRVLISASYDWTVRVWQDDGRHFTCCNTLCGHTAPVRSLSWNGTLLVTGAADGTTRLWTEHHDEDDLDLDGDDKISALKFSCSQRLPSSSSSIVCHSNIIFTSGTDLKVKIWMPDKEGMFHLAASLLDHRRPVNTLLADGKFLIAASTACTKPQHLPLLITVWERGEDVAVDRVQKTKVESKQGLWVLPSFKKVYVCNRLDAIFPPPSMAGSTTEDLRSSPAYSALANLFQMYDGGDNSSAMVRVGNQVNDFEGRVDLNELQLAESRESTLN